MDPFSLLLQVNKQLDKFTTLNDLKSCCLSFIDAIFSHANNNKNSLINPKYIKSEIFKLFYQNLDKINPLILEKFVKSLKLLNENKNKNKNNNKSSFF